MCVLNWIEKAGKVVCLDVGAFVAGLDAGHAYNTFPLMEGRLIPEEYWSIPNWRNAFENTAAVQFHHRVLAISTLTAVGMTWYKHRQKQLPMASQRLLAGLAYVTALQVILSGVIASWIDRISLWKPKFHTHP